MLDPTWRRIAGVHVEEDGTVGCVWLAHDTLRSVVWCYDSAKFEREVLAVIGQSISNRGRWIPLAWRKDDKPFADKLLYEAGVSGVLPEPAEDSQAMAEALSREVWQRMRASQFVVDEPIKNWLEEAGTFYHEDSKVPREGFPLMSATRHAIQSLAFARPEHMSGSKRPNHPQIRVI